MRPELRFFVAAGVWLAALPLNAAEEVIKAQPVEGNDRGATEESANEAQERPTIGSKGRLVITADRLFGVTWYQAVANYDTLGANVSGFGKDKQTGTTVGLMGATASTSGVFPTNHSAMPRLAVDYFLIKNLSLGGTLGFSHSNGRFSTDSTVNGTPASDAYDLDTLVGVSFAPRAGYSLAFTDTLGLWGLAGLEFLYTQVLLTGGGDVHFSLLMLNVQGMVYFALADNFALLAGPVLDARLSGSFKIDNRPPFADSAGPFKWISAGLAVSAAGHF